MNILMLIPLGLIGIVGVIAIFWRPAIGAALLLGLVLFERELVFGGFSLVKWTSILCLGILALRLMFLTNRKIKVDLTTWLIIFLVVWIGITSLWSPDQSDVIDDWISLVLQSSMYFLILNLVWSKEDLKLVLWGYVIGGAILTVIVGDTMIKANFERSVDMEFAGLGINLAARMVGLNLLVAILMTQLEKRYLAWLILIGIAIASGVSSVLALSRGNWYGLAISALVVVAVMTFKNRLQFTIIQFVVLAIVGYVALYFASSFILSEHGLAKLDERFESAYTFNDNASGRFDIWLSSVKPFLEKPLLGNGYNSFQRATNWQYAGAHSAYVLVAVEDGLIGLILFLLIFWSVFLKLWRLLLDKHADPVALGWGMALLVFLGTVSSVDTAVNRKYLWFGLSLISLLAQYYGIDQAAQEKADEDQLAEKTGTANQFA